MAVPVTDLAELVADLRAVLEDARLRGARGEDPGAPLPEPITPQRAGETPTPPSEEVPAHSGWAALAATAREAAETRLDHGADGLRRVREDLGDCRRCGLARGRHSIVFGVGDPEADLVVVGEAPGFHEDRRGEPFVGPAGQMLDRMLENVLHLRRDEVYICNVVKCRPPENRNPLPDEVDACLPFLRRQVEALRPKVLLVLGKVAYQTLFAQPTASIVRNRGLWREYEGVPALPTLHPAYLLRRPEDKRLVFEDLKALRSRYDALGGRRR